MIVPDLIARRRLHSSGSPAFRKASNPDCEVGKVLHLLDEDYGDTFPNPLIQLASMTLGGVTVTPRTARLQGRLLNSAAGVVVKFEIPPVDTPKPPSRSMGLG
jgi:hypothetical protein